jgi:molecular chaperone DnaJ
MKKEEAYSALGLSASASKDEAKKKFRDLSKKLHPDVNKSSTATEEFKKVNEAYDSIKNDKFDDEPQFHGGSGFNPFGGMGINLNDLINGFSGFNQRRQQRNNFPPIEINLDLSFKEAVLGARKELNFKRQVKCQPCDGQARSAKDNGCAQCKGTGKVIQRNGNMLITSTCNKCNGKTEFIDCKQCNSTGCQSADTTISVNVPAGAFNNTLRLGGIGHFLSSAPFGDEHTDVYVHLKSENNQNFQVEENDLIYKLPLSLLEALEGGKRKIPTIDGDMEIEVPKLSRNLEEIVIPKMGLARLGNQRVQLDVSYPKDVTSLVSTLRSGET